MKSNKLNAFPRKKHQIHSQMGKVDERRHLWTKDWNEDGVLNYMADRLATVALITGIRRTRK